MVARACDDDGKEGEGGEAGSGKPPPGVRVRPVKGTGVLWYNYHYPDGQPGKPPSPLPIHPTLFPPPTLSSPHLDGLTQHMGCPVRGDGAEAGGGNDKEEEEVVKWGLNVWFTLTPYVIDNIMAKLS